MANVTKIKFQYFKPLEKGTTEHTTGGEREAGPGGHGRAGHPRVGRRRRGPRGPGAGGPGRREGAGLGGRRALPPRRQQRRPDSRAGRLRGERRRADLSREARQSAPSPGCARPRNSGDAAAPSAATGTPRAGSGFPGNVLQPREHAGKAPARQ